MKTAKLVNKANRSFISIAQKYPTEAKSFERLNSISPTTISYYDKKHYKYLCARCGEIVSCNINDRKRTKVNGIQRYDQDKDILCKRCSSIQRSLNSKKSFKGVTIAQYLKDDEAIKQFIELNRNNSIKDKNRDNNSVKDENRDNNNNSHDNNSKS